MNYHDAIAAVSEAECYGVPVRCGTTEALKRERQRLLAWLDREAEYFGETPVGNTYGQAAAAIRTGNLDARQ